MMKQFIVKHPVALSISWAITIFILCATPGQYIPSASWMDLLSVDKIIHASIFFILTALLFIVVDTYGQDRKFVIIYTVLSLLYGLLMELMQAFCFSNRSADWMDVLANSFGCALALLLRKKIAVWISPQVI